ncbi:MAG: PD-(D/E)XK nuclease family protein [Microthrixaceae bacterium]
MSRTLDAARRSDPEGSAREVDSARARLDEAILPLGDVLVGAGAPLPLTLSNSTMGALDRCAGQAVALAGGDRRDPTWAMLRGKALDAYVQHALHVGVVGDPVEDLRSMWVAEERDEDLAALEEHLSGDEAGCVSDLASLGSSVEELRALAAFVARTEQRVDVDVGGVMNLAGRIDVLIGGPGTGHRSMILEVKSSALRPEHSAQVRHYVMLTALRQGELPAAAGVWSPGVGVTDVPVNATLGSSAERVAAAAVRTAELWAGEAPRLHPGTHCRWCPELDRCPEALHPDSHGDEAWDLHWDDRWEQDRGER